MRFTATSLATAAFAGVMFTAAALHAAGPAAGAASAASPEAERMALQDRLKTLQDLEASDVCLAPGPVLAALGMQSLSVASQAPLARQDLVDLLQKAVVLVIAERDTGSGFFIDGTTILTNRHVVARAEGDEVVVVGAGIGGPRTARIVAAEGGGADEGRDYAVLRMNGSPALASLAFAPQATELEGVVAAGYPGLLLDNDKNYKALVGGDIDALPDLALSQGAVMALQNRNSPVPTIAHSAPISGGNSGGPLVDLCGRVVGINTFINVSVNQASSAGFAIAAEDVLRYLGENGLTPQLHTGTCN